MRSFSILPEDDHRHSLQPGEREVFYFQLTSPDGAVFGFLRTSFDHERVTEGVTLSIDGLACEYQCETQLARNARPGADASGPTLTLTCLKPWNNWRCRFSGVVPEIGTQNGLQVDVELSFAAVNTPTHYLVGDYHRVQQDGLLNGRLRVGAETWEGELVCYRDHSWGRRSVD
ncbi:MAG: hypothetical protein JXD18_15290 [Anaerolineae bacterium]|nr:hypothetical protein [Anaerolineae bacterium]